jgi:hypothetical protein
MIMPIAFEIVELRQFCGTYVFLASCILPCKDDTREMGRNRSRSTTSTRKRARLNPPTAIPTRSRNFILGKRKIILNIIHPKKRNFGVGSFGRPAAYHYKKI